MLQFAMAVESQQNLFKRLGKVAMSHIILVFEIMNEKHNYMNEKHPHFNINFRFTSDQ